MLADLDEPGPRHVEQRVDLARVAVKVFDRERIDGDVRDVEFQQEAQDAFQRFEPFLVADADGQVSDAGAAPVPVHDEGDVVRSRTESEGVDDEGSEERVAYGWDPRQARREREVDVAGGRRGWVLRFPAPFRRGVQLYSVRYDEHTRARSRASRKSLRMSKRRLKKKKPEEEAIGGQPAG